MDDGLYGPRSVTWRLVREAAMLLGGPRALLLQLAHPLVAAGVSEHSTFPNDAVRRLYRTLDRTLALVFGTTEEAERSAGRINAAHRFVNGKLPEASGRFEAGTPYDALDPELLLWVHATLIQTNYTLYPLVVGDIPEEALQRSYEESKTIARLLGVTEDILPPDLASFRRYFDDTIASDAIAVAPFQRELGRAVLYPPIRGVPRPVFWPTSAFTISILPPKVRSEYGFELSGPARAAAGFVPRAVRSLLPALPRGVRWMPHARRAYRRTAA
jgi:uncharacterized protein (DUF2236 family)